MFSKEIFRAYDIRGEYNKEFDNDFAFKLGEVLVRYLNAKKIVVSRDARDSSGEIVNHVIEGITSTGCDVIDIGVTSTPLYYYGVITEGAGGGVMITASHMGDKFNGFKITGARAVNIAGDTFWESVSELFDENTESESRGEVFTKDILADYVESVVEHSGLKPGDIKSSMKLIGNEMIINEARAVAEKLSISIVENGENIAFEFDSDGDRLAIFNPNGKKIRGDLIGGMLAGYYYPNSKTVYDIRYSRGVLEYMRSKGIKPIPSKIGHTLIKAVMREHEVNFCGEQSGHMYFKEMGYVEASTLALLKIMNVIKETGKNIDELIEPINKWSTTEEINFPKH